MPAAVEEHLRSYPSAQHLRTGSSGRMFFMVTDEYGRESMLKLIPKSELPSFPAYVAHLQRLGRSLDGPNLSHVLAPEAAGELTDHVFVRTRYISGAIPLSDALDTVSLFTAVRVLTGVAACLDQIHRRGVIHADLKPANILLSDRVWGEAYLIDFGMIAHNERDEMLVIGTYRYLPPELNVPAGGDATSGWPLDIGPYIDLYALGVTSLELLSGTLRIRTLPSPLTHTTVVQWLSSGGLFTGALTVDLSASILLDMLRARERGVTSADVHRRLELLAGSVNPRSVSAPPALATPVLAPPDSAGPGLPGGEMAALVRAIQDMERIAERVEEASKVIIMTAEGLQQLAAGHEPLADEMSAVFSNAMARAKQSWTATMGMTLLAFGLLVALIVTAAVMTVVTRSPWWGLLLGGASFSGIFGYLVWKPFDRVFQATMIVGQLEMIHLQAAASMRATEDTEARAEIYERAIAALEELRARTAGDRTSRRRGRTRKPSSAIS
jgi:protein kinase-like protein